MFSEGGETETAVEQGSCVNSCAVGETAVLLSFAYPATVGAEQQQSSDRRASASGKT